MSGARLAAGVDVALERKGIDLVALDERRAVVASCGRLAVADVARCMAELRPAVVCIDSPPAWAPTGRNRIAERALWAAGIGIFGTPSADLGQNRFYDWMRVGVLDGQGVAQSLLPNLDRVDATLAALTGQVALSGVHCHVGDPHEGTILLPVAELPPSLRASAQRAAVTTRSSRMTV